MSKGAHRPLAQGHGVPSRKGKQPLRPQEMALCNAVVELLMDRHRERKRKPSDGMPGGSVRKTANPLKKKGEGKR